MKTNLKKILFIVLFSILFFLLNNNVSYGATFGIEVSDYNTLKSYLELKDGNTYHIYLTNDIAVTDTIYTNGTKLISGSKSSSGYTIYNSVSVNTDVDGGESIHVNSGSNLTLDKLIFNRRS